ncbi:MAG: phosphatidylglycerol lysyltransferase domain-containing protein [Pseudomonadota bacterium]
MTIAPLESQGFKPLELTDKEAIGAYLRADPPQTSELTFTNLFMWREHYRPLWRVWGEHLLLVLQPHGQEAFGLPPIGPGDLTPACLELCRALGAAGQAPSLRRLGGQALERIDQGRLAAVLDRDQSDYVYLSADLIALSGNRFHRKKNHLNKFRKAYPDYEYRPLDEGLVCRVLAMQQDWCALRDCASDVSLANEDQAIYEALKHFEALDFVGGAILVQGKVEAFSLGEPLNPDTAVIHIEKANPELPGLYAAINQRFAQEAWAGYAYINREQDLGIEGLKAAKESYNPHHLVDKYILTPL